MTTTHEGRTYTMAGQDAGERTAADLRARGFDGTVWIGTSAPANKRQRERVAMFYRTPAGDFVFVAAA